MNVDVSQPAFNVLAGPPNPEVGHVRPAPYRVGATHAQDTAAQAEGGAPANAGAAPVSDSSPAPQFAQPSAAHVQSPAGAPGPPPLVYTSIPVDRFRLDIRPLAPRRLLPLALGLLVLLLLSQPARATSHRVQASPQPFRLLTSQGMAGTQPTRSLSRRDMQPPRPSPLPGNRPGQAYSQIRQFAHIQPAPMVPKMTHVQKPPTSPSPPFPTRPKAYKGQ
jgi:hypothetical protein